MQCRQDLTRFQQCRRVLHFRPLHASLFWTHKWTMRFPKQVDV
jgi:hypothetical protein